MTPTVRTAGRTAKLCHSSRYSPARLISSITIASAARRISARSGVTSPMMRTASPGPGKGWRQTISSGRPSSSPTARTSSLNNCRSGSTSSKAMSSGSPPTLWWDLMLAASFVPDSMTSG